MMSGLSFLTPALLYGLMLGSVPIIIHLLFRRRFRRVEWAPMKYLKLSIKRTRRRVRLEQLILLAMRVTAVLLLFFLVARPVLRAEGLGAWLGGSGRTSRLLLVDNSLSMAYESQGRSALRRATELAGEWLRHVGPQDRVTIALASNPRAPLLRDVEPADRASIQKQIDGIAQADTHTVWGRTLAATAELVESATYPIREVVVITDLRRAGWDPAVAEVARRWSADRVKLRIYDVGTDETDNIALLDLEPADRAALVGTAARWEAVIRNGRRVAVDELTGTFTVDGKSSAVRLPRLEPGQTLRAPLSATFQEAGRHSIAFALPADNLPRDNQRWAVTRVREQLHLQLVDGEPSSDPLAGEVDFLGLALSVGVGDAEAWQVEVLTDQDWASAPLRQPDMLVLANVASLPPQRAAELERLVAAGTGLMIFVGGQTDIDNYNSLLHRNGAGILPARLEAPVDNDRSGVLVEDIPRSPLEPLRQLNAAVLERVKVRRFVEARVAGEKGGDDRSVRVLARWNNAGGSPAILEKDVGRGRVLLWTTTADKEWTDWPTEPSYVLAVREATRAIVRADIEGQGVVAGQPIRRSLPAKEQATNPLVEAPDHDKPQPAAVEQPPAAATPPRPPGSAQSPDTAAGPTLVWTDTARSGLYNITWQDVRGAGQRDQFAVSPDSRESDLDRIEAQELRELFGTLAPEIIRVGTREAGALAVEGREIWRALALALLVLLAIEAAFATWVGRQR